MTLRTIFLFILSTPMAFAQAAAPQQNIVGMILPFALIFVVMYFLMIRPTNKRNKEHQALLSSIKKGDEILTTAGIIGRISSIGDNFILLEIAPNTEVKIQRQAVASLMPKGSYKGDLN